MKLGIRKTSIKKSLSARTKGRANRTIKSEISPLYGKKGMGIFHPKKAVKNKVYKKTTFDIFKKFR